MWLAGGILSGQTISTNTVELYDPVRQLSLPAPNMLRHRRNPKLIVIDDVLYAVGGDVEDVSYAVGSIERFELSKQAWVFVTFFLEPRRRGQCSIEAFGSKIFVFGGGYGQNIWRSWDFYDVYGNYWASQVQQNLQLSDPNFSPVHVPSESDKALLRRVSLQFNAARAEGMIGTAAAHNPYAWSS